MAITLVQTAAGSNAGEMNVAAAWPMITQQNSLLVAAVAAALSVSADDNVPGVTAASDWGVPLKDEATDDDNYHIFLFAILGSTSPRSGLETFILDFPTPASVILAEYANVTSQDVPPKSRPGKRGQRPGSDKITPGKTGAALLSVVGMGKERVKFFEPDAGFVMVNQTHSGIGGSGLALCHLLTTTKGVSAQHSFNRVDNGNGRWASVIWSVK